MYLLINPLCVECLWCMTFSNIFLEIIQKLMRTTHVHQEENSAFVLILLSFSRCDNIVLSPNGFLYYHFKLIIFKIRKQSNTSKELPRFAFIFYFSFIILNFLWVKECDCRVDTQLIINPGAFSLHINLSYKAQSIFKSRRELDAGSLEHYLTHFKPLSAE